MTWVPTSVATTAAAQAAAAHAAALRQEEERMTTYSADDLEGWEFKIVRAATSRFKTHEAVQQVCAEEAQAGWELVEKFDDSRIRFKRRTEHRSRDAQAQIDPYRTQVGISPAGLGLTIVAVVLGLVAMAGGIAFYLAQAH